jgi:hypothetical protein
VSFVIGPLDGRLNRRNVAVHWVAATRNCQIKKYLAPAGTDARDMG